MRKSNSSLYLKPFGILTILTIIASVICQSSLAAFAISPAGLELNTLREAVKSGNLTIKVNGDSISTTKISLQLTNTSNKPVRVVLPANEILKPNNPSVQTMILTKDTIVTVPPGETSILQVDTMCASAKSVPPPPPVTEGLNFEVTNFSDMAVWKKLAQIIAAGRELEEAGAFGNLMFPSASAIQALVDAEIVNLTEEQIKLLMKSNPGLSRSEAEAIVKNNSSQIAKQARRTVMSREKQKRRDQIAQMAIWKTLGILSGEEKDNVSQESIEEDVLKELAEQIKMDKTLLAQLGGKLTRKGKYIPSKQAKKALDQKTSLIFDVVNLTVKRSEAPKHVQVASLPSDDSCSTFCSVGERAFKQGDFEEALEVLKAAKDEAETFGEADPRLSRCLNILGMCFLDMTSYLKAEENFNRALALRQKVFGPESKEVGEVSNNLGLAKQQQQQFIDAEKYFKKAASIFDKTIGKTSDEVASTLNNLGKNHNLQDQAEEAKTPLAKSLTFSILNCPKDLKDKILYTPFVAEVETNLGDSYVKLGNYKRAASLYQKALSTDRKQLGENHPFLSKILDGLSVVASNLGQTDNAEMYKNQAKAIRSKSLGEDNIELAMLPLGHDAFTRIWNFVEGKKAIEANVANLKAAVIAVNKKNGGKVKINRPIRDKWALVVGISEFQDPSINLKYASKDATDFANFLVKEANFAPDHVRLLTNEKATREEIMAQLGDKWLPRVAGPDDLVLIYFSSHGSPTQMDVNSVNYLVAHNTNKNSLYATGIALQEFANTIKNRVHSKRVVLLMDACHSGAAIGAKGIFRNFGVDANQVAQGTGQMVICSSSSNQTSWESKRYPNSVFTHYLIEGLRKDPKLGNVFEFMRTKVQEEVQMDRNGNVQTPVLQSKWEGNDLVITVPPIAPKAGVQ